ncbi:MAG: hypothetical protein AAB575_01185 [Patescibacteria group bacterium]
MSKRVKIERDSDGKITIDFSGFSGDSCGQEDKKIRLFLNALGLETEETGNEPKKEKEPNPKRTGQAGTN